MKLPAVLKVLRFFFLLSLYNHAVSFDLIQPNEILFKYCTALTEKQNEVYPF